MFKINISALSNTGEITRGGYAATVTLINLQPTIP